MHARLGVEFSLAVAVACTPIAPFTLRTSPYVHVRQCTATYGAVRRRRTLQMLNYMLLSVMLSMGDGRQRNAKFLRLDLCGMCA